MSKSTKSTDRLAIAKQYRLDAAVYAAAGRADLAAIALTWAARCESR